MQVEELAPAKVNLWLRVLCKQEDGYHQVETVLQTINLTDRLILKEAPHGISLSCNDPRLPCDRRNLAFRAAELLSAYAPDRGVRIYLEKRIPWQAGLGGGSSDAAAVLRGLNKLWELNLPWQQLVPLASSLGADVPFFLQGGTGIGRGKGDQIEKLAVEPDLVLILVKPPFGLATSLVYSRWEPAATQVNRAELAGFLQVLQQADSEQIALHLRNDLEQPAFALEPELALVKRNLQQAGYHCLLSGSGSNLFILLPDNMTSQQTVYELQRANRLLPPDYETTLVRTRF